MPSVDDLQAKLRAVLEPRSEVLVAYLFGSVARGTSGPLSDVDVAVLLSDDVDPWAVQLELMAAVASVIGSSDVDVLVLNRAPCRSRTASSATGSSSSAGTSARGSATGRPRCLRISTWNRSVERSAREPITGSRRAGLVDPESVERRLREIDRRIVAARGVRDRGRELFLADEDLQTLAEHHLQIAIQSAIDIASTSSRRTSRIHRRTTRPRSGRWVGSASSSRAWPINWHRLRACGT
jgi:predicted nucleotidyltransferase